MPRRLTLVVHSLASGGAERVLAMMANHWATRGDEVTLITLDVVANDECKLVTQVNRIGLGLMRDTRHLIEAVSWNFRRARSLRNAIQASQPDHVISFTEKVNVLTLLACRGLPIDVVIAERTDPRRHDIGRVWSVLRRVTYPRCRALVVQTERVRDSMRQTLSGKPIYVVPNAVDAPQPQGIAPVGPESREHSVVAMGRLVPSKGFGLLIDAFSKIAIRHQNWNLVILGKGPEQEVLEAQIHRLGLRSRVTLPGWSTDPSSVLQASDLFVMSSQYEGFPNALLEAMAAGLAAISFDCESGPSEIIRQNVDGLLVPAGDVALLSQSMDRLMSNESERARLANRAREVVSRFSTEKHFQRWDAVLRGANEQEFSEIAEGDK